MSFLFQNGVAYYRFPKVLINKLSPEAAIMLMHLVDLEELLKPGFYQTHKQFSQALGWGRRKLVKSIDELKKLGLVHTENKNDKNKTHFYIIEERVLELIDSGKQSAQNVRSRSHKMYRQRQDLNKTSTEQSSVTNSAKGFPHVFNNSSSQTFLADSQTFNIDDLLPDTLPKLK